LIQEFSKYEVLIDLGLTLKQARVYLSLVEYGPLKTSAISKASNVARPDVYSTLLKLQQLSLVEKIIKKPLTYRAIAIDKGLSFLLEIKRSQFQKVRAETQLFLDSAKKTVARKEKESQSSQFVLIPKGRIVIDRINTAIAQTQQSIDLLLSWKRFSRGIVDTFAESMENAWEKKVKFKFILESPSECETARQLIHFCKDKPFCQMRFIRDRPAVILGIYDNKEAFIIINPDTDLPGSPALWFNNSSFITLVDEYFKILWLTAMEQPKY